MKPIGLRDGDVREATASDAEVAATSEGPWFDTEPFFVDEAEPVQVEIPGRPGEFISIQVLSDGVAKGRSRFYRTQHAARGKGQAEVTSTVLDAEGLSLYLRENAIVDFRIVNRKTGAEIRFNPRNPGENRAVYKRWTGSSGAWVDEQIARVNGWTEREEAAQERFPEAAA
jgi:hypothetical protein